MKPDMLTVARTLAPEDIAEGMYIAVLHEHESVIPMYLADNLFDVENLKPYHWRTIPEKVRPMKVVGVCVPYVLAETTSGKSRLLDIRKTSLAGLSDQFGKVAFKRLRPKKKRSRGKADKTDNAGQSGRSWKRLWRRSKD